MKYMLFTALTIFSFTTFAKTDVAIIAKQLSAIAESGMNEYVVEGTTREEMVKSLQVQLTDDSEGVEFLFNHTNVQTMDEYVWGTTDAQSFSDVLFAAIHFMDDDANESQVLYTKKEISTIENLLKDLKNADVIYSWNPHGDSVCGQMLTTPVVIDVKTKMAYEFNFYKIEGC